MLCDYTDTNKLHLESNSIALFLIMFGEPPTSVKVSYCQVMLFEQRFKENCSFWVACCWSRRYYERLRPAWRILLTLFEYVLCQSTWSEPQAADVAVHAAWIWDSLSSLACQVDCNLFQHMHTRIWCTCSRCDAWMYTWVLANRCTNKFTLIWQKEGELLSS